MVTGEVDRCKWHNLRRTGRGSSLVLNVLYQMTTSFLLGFPTDPEITSIQLPVRASNSSRYVCAPTPGHIAVAIVRRTEMTSPQGGVGGKISGQRFLPSVTRFLLYCSSFDESSLSAAELIQYRRPVVSRGPSGKTCPRWASQRLQRTSI